MGSGHSRARVRVSVVVVYPQGWFRPLMNPRGTYSAVACWRRGGSGPNLRLGRGGTALMRRSEIVCPLKCSGGYSGRARRVAPKRAGITPLIARAAKLAEDDELYTCNYCSCVWRGKMDTHFLHYRTEILGEYGGPNSATAFRPVPWLKRAIGKLQEEEGQRAS